MTLDRHLPDPGCRLESPAPFGAVTAEQIGRLEASFTAGLRARDAKAGRGLPAVIVAFLVSRFV